MVDIRLIDIRLRKELYGRGNEDCFNIRTIGCDNNGETGFVGQTVRVIKELRNEVAFLTNKVIQLERKKRR